MTSQKEDFLVGRNREIAFYLNVLERKGGTRIGFTTLCKTGQKKKAFDMKALSVLPQILFIESSSTECK